MMIGEALTRFLGEERERLTPRTFRNYDDVIDLFRDRMNGYGPNILSGGRSRALAHGLRCR